LKKQKENALRTYGDNIPEFLNALEANRRLFSGEVVGPIGRHVRLKDQKWRSAIEAVIGNLLSNFIVQNWQDEKRLKEMLRKYGWYPSPHFSSLSIFRGSLPKRNEADLVPSSTPSSSSDNAIVTRDNWTPLDVRSAKPDRRFTTALDQLEIGHPVIEAMLIDIRNIEQTILLGTFDEAAKVVYREQPRNVMCAFILQGAKVYLQ